MIRQYLAFASLLIAAVGIVAQSGHVDARWRCHVNGGGQYNNGYGWHGANRSYGNNGWYGNGYAYGNGGYYNGGYYYGNGFGNNYSSMNQAAAPNNGYVTNRPTYGQVTTPQAQPMINAPVNVPPNVAPAPPNAAPRTFGGQTSVNGALPNPENSNGTVEPPTR